MITEGKVANSLGGKTARACDSCLKKRARWFCAADDAFLCQACDISVHSANQLASRHDRVRLGTASFKASASKGDDNFPPTWHHGFTRKARTPRNTKPSQLQQLKDNEKMGKAKSNVLPLVPEIGSDEISLDESEEHLLFCRVPVFDPFAAELCTELSDELQNIQVEEGAESFTANELDLDVLLKDDHDLDIPELIGSDAELAGFAADVENLLGTGLEEGSCEIEGLGVMECKEEFAAVEVNSFEDKRVKIEDEDDQEVQAVIACHLDPALDMARETLNWDFDYSYQMKGEEEEMKVTIGTSVKDTEGKEEERRMMRLKLNYEEVITAWASQGSPWADGTKPEFNPDDCWPDFMGTREIQHPHGTRGSRDEEREARVSRYREKRRTRLFSKKIRYEVRKLNAEKRPRMKGRFVKRTSFAGPSFPYLVNKSS